MSNFSSPRYMPYIFPHIAEKDWPRYSPAGPHPGQSPTQRFPILNYLVACAATLIPRSSTTNPQVTGQEGSPTNYVLPANSFFHPLFAEDQRYGIRVSLCWQRVFDVPNDPNGRILLQSVEFVNICFAPSGPGTQAVQGSQIITVFQELLPPTCNSIIFSNCSFGNLDALNQLSTLAQGNNCPRIAIQGEYCYCKDWVGTQAASDPRGAEGLVGSWSDVQRLDLTRWPQGLGFVIMLSEFAAIRGSVLTDLWLSLPPNTDPASFSLKAVLSCFPRLSCLELEISQDLSESPPFKYFDKTRGYGQKESAGAPRLHRITVYVTEQTRNNFGISRAAMEDSRAQICEWAAGLSSRPTSVLTDAKWRELKSHY
ncbi:hypothetical protein C8Q76DRAFT_826397 [Earliella scabrosa]|nr:hypothetical protein C8Q76DRAFT_826397 [Earliella scabrosa]